MTPTAWSFGSTPPPLATEPTSTADRAMADQTKQPPLNRVRAADLPAYPFDEAAALE
jgi:hypothetical protein